MEHDDKLNQPMDLSKVVEDVANALVDIDSSRIPFKDFQPGVGPYGEPQLMRAVVQRLGMLAEYAAKWQLAERRTF